MKAWELRELSSAEIQNRLNDGYEELFNLRFQWSMGQLKDNTRMTQVKRDIARMKTILRERELVEMWEAERAL